MIRGLAVRCLLTLALAALALPALAQSQERSPSRGGADSQSGRSGSKPERKSAPKAEPSKKTAETNAVPGAQVLETFDDWKAYATEGKSKICYALSQPTTRQPATIKDTTGYLFVSFRPADKVSNEIALVMGFATKDGGGAEALIGSKKFDLVTKGPNAWIKNQSEEGQVISSMLGGKDLVVKAVSGRGNATTDRYSLKGFKPALERARKECRVASR